MPDFYRRHLPHYQPPEGSFHVVFRLDGSLPKEVIERLEREQVEDEKIIGGIQKQTERVECWRKLQKAYFEKFDALLDGSATGPKWLAEPAVADLVCEAMHFRDSKQYDLFAYTVMPNHVHMVFSIVGRIADSTKGRFHLPFWHAEESADESSIVTRRIGDSPYIVTKILQDLKKYTAVHSNKVLHREGQFWQHESYDHVIRNAEELERMIWYVLDNPVKAGLVGSWEKWKWSYVREGFV
jgi:REP element-mobilizing transposase RayT